VLNKTNLSRVLERILLTFPGGRQAFDVYSAIKLVKLSDIRDRRRFAREGPQEGRPLPGVMRMISVAGTPNARWFLESGVAAVQCLRQALMTQGRQLEDCRAILDFGVGCGRVIRHLEPLAERTRLCGVDINRSSIAWSRRHLPFMEASVCPLSPPLDYADSSFDLIYALSVFTHLPESLQHSWIQELSRLLRPGGLLFLTVHGASYLPDLGVEEQARFTAGELVVRRAGTAGSNLCGAYHPPAWISTYLLPGFSLLEHRKEGALGNPHQDYYLLQKL